MIRVLIVAAYASTRAGLHALLAPAPDCEVVGEASGRAEMESLLGFSRPDVVLLDAPEGEGEGTLDFEPGAGATPDAAPDVAVVLMGESPDLLERILARPLRGWGWISREADGPEIAAAIRAAASGLVALDAARASLLLGQRPNAVLGAHGFAQAIEPGDVSLTAREREVLQLLASGLPNKSIARRLGISPHTVKFHVASILSKLGAASRTEAVSIGARNGLLLL